MDPSPVVCRMMHVASRVGSKARSRPRLMRRDARRRTASTSSCAIQHGWERTGCAAAVGGSRMHARAQRNVAAYDRITSPRSSTSTAARSGDAATCCGSVRHVATCCNTLQRIPSLRSSIGTAELSSRRSDAGARWWQSGQRRTCTVIVTPAPASRARACATASSAAKEPFPVSARRTTESPVRKPASFAAAASSDAELRARVA